MIALGQAGVAGGIVLAFWPIHHNGVSGNAITPHYGDFGWFAYAPLPAHPSLEDLRRGGVTVPQDVVAERRRGAAVVAAAGVTAVAAGLLSHRRLDR